MDEARLAGEPGSDYVCRIARAKAEIGYSRVLERGLPNLPVLAADTAVVLNQEVMGKPRNAAHAEEMLRMLSGRPHRVLTAVAVAARKDDIRVRTSISTVEFRKLSEREICSYASGPEAHDKAGAYAIQGKAAVFISGISGSYSGIMGLPLYETAQLLEESGITIFPELAILALVMNSEILVNVTPQETRVAVIEQGAVQELHIERTSSRGIVGNIYNGRVIRVLPGMQSAFVDIGLDRAAFLHLADIWRLRQSEDADKPIERLLHEGKNILVQVIKDSIGTKGARLSTQLSIAGRMLVYLPQVSHIGISQRIEDETERKSLREKLKTFAAGRAKKAALSSGPWRKPRASRICRLISNICISYGSDIMEKSSAARAGIAVSGLEP